MEEQFQISKLLAELEPHSLNESIKYIATEKRIKHYLHLYDTIVNLDTLEEVCYALDVPAMLFLLLAKAYQDQDDVAWKEVGKITFAFIKDLHYYKTTYEQS